MFGYIKLDGYAPVIYRDYFRRNYCFLCRALDKHYGYFARLFVSYDVTFFTVLFSSDYYLENIKKVPCYKTDKKLKTRLKDEYAKKVAALKLMIKINSMLNLCIVYIVECLKKSKTIILYFGKSLKKDMLV